MTESTALVEAQDESAQTMTVQGVHRQVALIQEIMKTEMKDGEHFGTIPGCGPKKCLLKSGAEKLNLLFRMAPRFKTDVIDLGNGHREYRIVTELYSITTGKFLGEGVGSCSTMETKYRYRDEKRRCPACDGEFIIKGKEEYGGGWLCYAKKGGCGEKYKDDEPAITEQVIGKIENIDIADTYNTCFKMGKKRSLVDGTLTATAASDIFTQDIEENAPEVVATEAKAEPKAPINQPTRASEAPAGPAVGSVANPDDSFGPPPPGFEEQAEPTPAATTKPAPNPKWRKMASKKESLCTTCKKKITIGTSIFFDGTAWQAHHAEHFA